MDFEAEVNRICARLALVSKAKRKAEFLRELGKLPPIERDLALQLVATAMEISNGKGSMKRWETFTMVFGGAAFLIVLLVIAIAIPRPTEFQVFVFRIVLAIGAAAFGCVLPGFLNIQSKTKLYSLRAGGALALFIVVFLINPPKLLNEGSLHSTRSHSASNSTNGIPPAQIRTED